MKAAELLKLVLENSKGRETAPGEMKKPTYANLKTPDNHKRGSREATAKNLGERPSEKKVTQVQGPKGKVDNGGPAAPVKKMSEARTAGAKRRYGQGNNENRTENVDDFADIAKDEVYEGISSQMFENWVSKLLDGSGPGGLRVIARKYLRDNPELLQQFEKVLSSGMGWPEMKANAPAMRVLYQVYDAVTKDDPLIQNAGRFSESKKQKGKIMKESVGEMLMGMLMKMSGPKFGRKLYADLKKERPDLYQGLVQQFGKVMKDTMGMGAISDVSAFKSLMKDPEAYALADKTRAWAQDKLRQYPEADAWFQKKAEKLRNAGLGVALVDPMQGGYTNDEDAADVDDGLGDDFGDADEHSDDGLDGPDQPRRPFGESSKFEKTAPGEMAKPAVEKKSPAKSASVPSSFSQKSAPASDKKPDKNKAFAQFRDISVKKVQEGVEELAKMGINVSGLNKKKS